MPKMTALRYSDEQATIKGNESDVASFCRDFFELDRLTVLERIELLDDLVKPDCGVSEMALFLLPQLLEVVREKEGVTRLNLITAVADIQRALASDEVERSGVSPELYGRDALQESCRELRMLISHSHTEAWRNGVEELIAEPELLAN